MDEGVVVVGEPGWLSVIGWSVAEAPRRPKQPQFSQPVNVMLANKTPARPSTGLFINMGILSPKEPSEPQIHGTTTIAVPFPLIALFPRPGFIACESARGL